MYVSPAVAEEFKRIIKDSEIVKSVTPLFAAARWLIKDAMAADGCRENDDQWPKKNIVGRQELEVRIDRDHISFEVSLHPSFHISSLPSAPIPMSVSLRSLRSRWLFDGCVEPWR